MATLKGGVADKLFEWTTVLILLLICITMLYPFYYLLIYSLNDPLDAMRGGIYFWPRKYSTLSYELVFSTNNIAQAAFISFSRTVLGTISSVFCTATLAYVLSRPNLLFRKFFNKVYVVTMYVNGGLIPYYMIVKSLGLKNNFLVYIIPGLIGVFNMILVRTYMEELPSSLWESAEIDGANDFTIFIKIIFPLCKPVIAVIAIYNAVGAWNSWFDNFIFCPNATNLRTLQLILMNMLKTVTIEQSEDIPLTTEQLNMMTPESLRAAMTIIVTFPIILVYPFFQKHFTQGIMIGAIKG